MQVFRADSRSEVQGLPSHCCPHGTIFDTQLWLGGTDGRDQQTVTLRNKTTGWYAGVQAHSSKTARLEQVLQIQQLNPSLEKMVSPHHDHLVMKDPPRQAGSVYNWVCIAGPETSHSVWTLNSLLCANSSPNSCLNQLYRADKLLPLCLNTSKTRLKQSCQYVKSSSQPPPAFNYSWGIKNTNTHIK